MADRENKIMETRRQILDELLSDRNHSYSWEDLTNTVNDRLALMEKKEVTRRTIEKDIDFLKHEPYFAEIETYTVVDFNRETMKPFKKKCLRYEDPTFSIYKKEMTDDEKYLLSEALSILGQFDGLPDFAGLDRLKKSAIVKHDREIVSFTKNPVEKTTVFGKLFSAIANKQVIELHYHTFAESDDIKVNVFHPYLLKEYNNRWYLFAAAFTDGKLLNFALDRINDCVPLPNHKYKEYEGDLNEWFDDIVGVTLVQKNPVEHILLWASDQGKGYLETKPIHDTHTTCRNEKEVALREKYPMLKGGAFLSIDCRENYELISVCSYGMDLLVVESHAVGDVGNDYVTVKDEVVIKNREMLEEYKKLQI